MQRLGDIAIGRATRTITGERSARTEEPTFSEQIHAIKELNKIDGIDTRVSIEKSAMTATMKRLQREIVSELQGKRKKARDTEDEQAAIVANAESMDVDDNQLSIKQREN
jgi:hypothetical protein